MNRFRTLHCDSVCLTLEETINVLSGITTVVSINGIGHNNIGFHYRDDAMPEDLLAEIVFKRFKELNDQ